MRKKSDVLPVLAEYFDVYLPVTRGVSDNTVRSYQHTFRLLFEFLYSDKNLAPEKVSCTDLEDDTIERFLSWLETDRGCSSSTRN